MMYVRSPLSLRQVEDLLCERGIDLCHETVRYWWHRVGPLCAAEIRTRRVHHRCYSLWRWHLDEVRGRINGKTHSRWRAVDHEGEVVEGVVTKRRDRRAALEFLQRALKRDGRPASIVTDRRQSSRAAMKVIGHEGCQETRRWFNNRAEHSEQPFRRYCQVDENHVVRPPRYWAQARREPAILGIRNGRQPQLDCEHDPSACRGRSVTPVGAGGRWPDPQLD